MSPPTADRFRRLARSSPWRWRTLEFRWWHEDETVRHAWLRRPGALRVEEDGRAVQAFDDPAPFPGARVYSGDGWQPMRGRWPSDVAPVYAEDGLVAQAPKDFDIDYDNPYFENYHWVAMLNPVEFADRVHDLDPPPDPPVELSDLEIVEHRGRVAWQAVARPTAFYNPRCDCCALLSGHLDQDADEWRPGPPSVIRLDEQTGVCVRIEGADSLGLEVEILAVDDPIDDSLFEISR
ncbi:hypothetical protein [Nocardia blacklockiae]|uniref:hypothetical protein n=1 Tax=Nocardia blacklockiae TaxID=480036 RepID=UPI0018954391|nr:hypothetical protein [Nocardia blacklockiae]MBF6169890.1 hypothetical protein [Nocardia blacklockiae]